MLKILKKIYQSIIYKIYILTGEEEILIKPQNINLLIEIRDPIEREMFFNLSYEEEQITTLLEFSKKVLQKSVKTTFKSLKLMFSPIHKPSHW